MSFVVRCLIMPRYNKITSRMFHDLVFKRFCLQSITGKPAASSPKTRISPTIAAPLVSKKGGKTMSCKGNKTAACGGRCKFT